MVISILMKVMATTAVVIMGKVTIPLIAVIQGTVAGTLTRLAARMSSEHQTGAVVTIITIIQRRMMPGPGGFFSSRNSWCCCSGR